MTTTRAERDDRIEALHRAGKKPSDISRHVRMPTLSVRAILEERGVDLTDPFYAAEVAKEWVVDSEDRRRELIIARAARGARKQRLENAAQGGDQ